MSADTTALGRSSITRQSENCATYRERVDDGEYAQQLEQLELRKLRAEVEHAESLAARSRLELAAAERKDEEERLAADQVGVYIFYSELDRQTVSEAINELSRWSRRGHEQHFQVILNSPGGLVADGLAFYDFLRGLSDQGHHVETVGLGRVESMAAVLLQAGDHRVLTRNSTMMIHHIQQSVPKAPTPEVGDAFTEMQRIETMLLNLLCERSTLKKSELRQMWERKDFFMSAADALKYGLCDEVRGRGHRRRPNR